MKNIKNLIYLLAAFLTVGMVSCSDDATYEPGQLPDGKQVFFSNIAGSQFYIDKDATSVTIPVMRKVTEGAYTANIQATTEYASIFNIPATVTFADGKNVADLVITFSFANITPDKQYGIKLLLNDVGNTTPYGSSNYAFSIAYSPWNSLGECMYTDDILTSVYGIDNVSFPVEVQESGTTPGLYRMKNVYHQDSPFYSFYNFSDGRGTSENYYIIINATDPTSVTIGSQPLGFSLDGFGDLGVATYKVTPGTLVNGIITFPKNGLALILSPERAVAANINGLFKLMLPGAIEPATVAIDYLGQFMSPAGLSSAMLTFTADQNTVLYKYAVVAGNISKDDEKIEQTAQGIIDGTIESESEVASAEVKYPISVAGAYTVVAVPFDSENRAGETAVKPFTFILGDVVTLQTGSYSMPVQAAKPYTDTFTISAGSSINQYVIDGIFGFGDLNMYATFDPISLTLTLDGSWEGDKDPIWGTGLAYANEEKTEMFCILSGSTGTDNCVISVDGTGVPTVIKTLLGLYTFDTTTGNLIGIAEKIAADTALTPVAATPGKASSSRKMMHGITAKARFSSVSARF